MSDAELMGSAMLRFKNAKETLAKKKAEVEDLARQYDELVEALRRGDLPNFDLRTLPSEADLIHLRDGLQQSAREMESARDQLNMLGVNSSTLN